MEKETKINIIAMLFTIIIISGIILLVATEMKAIDYMDTNCKNMGYEKSERHNGILSEEYVCWRKVNVEVGYKYEYSGIMHT